LRYWLAAWAISALLILAAAGALTLSDRWPVLSTKSQVAGVYGFAMFLLAGVGFLLGVIALWHALRWKPPSPEQKEPSKQGDA